MSWASRRVSGLSHTISIGAKNAPLSRSAPTTSKSPPPNTSSAPWRIISAADPTAFTCARLASGPMRTPSAVGAPMVVAARRLDTALITSSSRPAGTIERRIAVHFCPAFVVISRVTSLMNRSNSSVPGTASGPRIEQFSESASMLKRTEFFRTAAPLLSFCPVAAEPVKATTSCSSRWSSISPALPHTN